MIKSKAIARNIEYKQSSSSLLTQEGKLLTEKESSVEEAGTCLRDDACVELRIPLSDHYEHGPVK